MEFNTYLNKLREKGNLAYEYNPFHNYQTDVDLYIIDNKYIGQKNQAVNTKNGEILNKKGTKWIDKRNNIISPDYIKEFGETLWAKAGSLIDLDTEQLNFDLEHPVDIEVQPSYDGSVNLILNDDKNIPRLINSRFSVREKDTYEIVDRIGENDTNVYNSKTFDKDTSLYFQYEYNPTIQYLGFVKGTLQVGQYCFYFTYCDSDDNESDIIAESGLIPVFIGEDNNPFSIDGGIKNQSSNKGIYLRLNNIDKSYNYIKIYYVRYFADYQQNRVYECKKLNKKYPIKSGNVYLQITGYEEYEDIDANLLNIVRFNPKNILTQAQCKNMLFFGNIVKNTDNYKELTDLSLRIIPELKKSTISKLDERYVSDNGDYGYYNSLNIYNKTGYFNQEYYRFGVVFIYQNGTLSNVYNTLGGVLTEGKDSSPSLSLKEHQIYNTSNEVILTRNYIKVDESGWIDSSNIDKGSQLNARGVCQLNYEEEYSDNDIFYIKFTVPKDVSEFLKEELGIRGLFFVRQKCVPNIIAQCYLLRMDEILQAPVLEEGTKDNKDFYTECFVSKNDRIIVNDLDNRLYKYSKNSAGLSRNTYAAICPDFNLNQPYYNQIFNGGKFKLQQISTSNSELKRNGRFFNQNSNTKYQTNDKYKKVTICSVTENVSTVALKDKVFRMNIGKAEEVYRFRYAEIDKGTYSAGDEDSYSKVNEATNIVRGVYSPYLAVLSENSTLDTGCLYNIYQDNILDSSQEFQNRMNSSEPFYAISDRFNLIAKDTSYNCWRGDCYVNQYTHRFNRNFNDSSLPNNDQIIDMFTWRDHYKIEDSGDWQNILRSDINAVQMGSWITFKVRSSMNYALRSVDHSYVSEEALMGAPRSFYPRSSLLHRGENKMPDSYLYNDAYRASLGFKCYFALQDMNYIKNAFSNRIQYSSIAIQDSYKNNYRMSLSTYFRDYSTEYGSIQKLVGFEGYILVIFEHAIGIAVINERILAGQGDGEPVFINTKNVLPEELTIITDTYGTQWPESVIKSEVGYVYGVDTIAKKIWRVKEQTIEILSDFKVNKFLVDNITLGERELYPIIGLKNVKTHYNNNKKDIMFTFYDDIYKDEEKVWNLCYNELLNNFITFYSWIPSYSANIDTKYFSFDRNTSKFLTLLNKSNYFILENTGVLIENPVFDDKNNDEMEFQLHYVSVNNSINIPYNDTESTNTKIKKTIEVESELESGHNEIKNIKFRLEKDHWQNDKLFEIDSETNKLIARNPGKVKEILQIQKVLILYITPYYEIKKNDILESGTIIGELKTESVAITLDSIINNPLLTASDKSKAALTTDFYLHGQAGIFNVAENLYPTHWYGEFHPFEFEVVVNDKIGQQKIFTNLLLIANKAEPESFHFEIEGDNYDFSMDKRNMYFRQEATKNLYQNLGSDIIFNRYYTDVAASKYTLEEYYRPLATEFIERSGKLVPIYDQYPIYYHEGLVQQVKSTIFPLYYERIDTFNDVYHKYHLMHDSDSTYDFQNLSGSEISWNRDLNQFNVVTHIKNSPIDKVGRLRGNSYYKEGKWNIQIPSIVFMQKNEEEWPSSNNYEKLQENGPFKDTTFEKIPPIIINSQYIPNDLDKSSVNVEDLPNIYTGRLNYPEDNIDYQQDISKYIQVSNWTSRKEVTIRDKWIKIRIRYSGKNLAIIHSLVTLYNLSYS